MTPSQKETRSRLFLNHALKLINAPLDVHERLELIARIIADYMGVDDVAIFLKQPGSDTLVLRASVGLDSVAMDNVRVPIGKGITGRVAENRTYIASRNILEDSRNLYSVHYEDDSYPSVLSFPILNGDELLGVVNIRSKTERDFSEKEAEELDSFTASIIVSIRNAQAFEQLEYKSQLLELTIKIAGSLTSTLDPDVILDEIAWEIANGFSINGVLIQLMSEDGTVVKHSSHGLKANFVKNYPLEVAVTCVKTGLPKISTAALDADGANSRDGTWNICLPLISHNTMGVISLFDIASEDDDPKGLFASIGIDVLQNVAGLAALAIENANMYAELKRLAEVEKQKRDVIDTMFSRMSAIFDTITQGIISVDSGGIIQDFNEVTRTTLGLTDDDKNSRNIDSVTHFKPPLSTIITNEEQLTNRMVTFISPSGEIDMLVTMRSFKDPAGEQQGCVISFRPLEETVKLLSRFNYQRPRYTFGDIIGHDSTMADIVHMARTAAQSGSNVLVVGESGTGKELFSQAIHNASPVAEGPFIPVNCAAIPKDLMESELFGYAEGAFTGARKGGYIGKFEQASGGTLFLDEIGDMPLDLQVKLLRVLQDKVIQRIGSEHIIPVTTRVIAATNRDLKAAVNEGTFREELYWRINVITINIPPLRERREDIARFIDFFIAKFADSAGKEIRDMEPAVLDRLMHYSWRGNIRELENAVEHAVLMSDTPTICWHDLPSNLKERIEEEAGETAPERDDIERAKRARKESSRNLYYEVMVQTQGNVEEAAERLGMSRATLYRRLKKYGLTDTVSKLRRGITRDTEP